MTKLVIVESPAKVETIRKFLPDGFKVDSSVGHVRDLPSGKKKVPKRFQDEEWADLAVNVDDDFEPVYVTIPGKQKVLRRLKKQLDDAEILYLATDEDREGESISWHLVEALNPDVPVKRMVFNEITKEAIQDALENPRDIDMHLVEAQEARRILDRLYGYTLSPLLWRKIKTGLSAGRVQSPAVRLVVMRERERRAFKSATYWDIQALLSQQAQSFDANLHELDGTRIATGADFDEDTGELKEGTEALIVDEDLATSLTTRLEDAPWTVANIDERARQSKPPAPFKTSTLQQAANGRLSLSPGATMRIAQDLYEDGHITYMRTDSTALSQEGEKGARDAIEQEWGSELVPANPRTYEDDTKEEAQEAHEAIRPAGATFTPPDDAGLSGRHKQLYDLIYRRTLASQMPNEKYTSTTALIDATPTPQEDQPDVARFKATGKKVTFRGYRLAWPTSGDGPTELPPLEEADTVDLEELEPKPHETQPPKRFTEASLVQALEEEGIGRPSTYASIIERIQEKGYVTKQGRSLAPTLTAFAVTDFLEEHFPQLVDLEFTAGMEETLDAIAAGNEASRPYLEAFYHGDEGIKQRADEKQDSVEGSSAREIRFDDIPYKVKVGRYGPYVEHEPEDGDIVRANLPDDLTPDQITQELVERLIHQETEGPDSLGQDPETGEDIYLLTGRYGPYVQRGEGDGDEKPDRASLPEGMSMDEATLEDALWLLSLPETMGEHPDGGTVIKGIGRYGPYVAQVDGDDRTYANVNDHETLQHIEMGDALERIKAKKKRSQKGVLREMGEHPDTGETITLRGGRYGPYFKHKNTNKSLPDDLDIDEATLDDALFLVDLPETIGENPEGGTFIKDLGRYGPYIALEDEDGDRDYQSITSYQNLREATLEDALFLFNLPEILGEHPDGGTVLVKQAREGPYLALEQDGDDQKRVKGLTLRQLGNLDLKDALAHL